LGLLQRRVALFGLASGGLGLIFLVFRAVVHVADRDFDELRDPSFLYHLLGVALALSAWRLVVGPRLGSELRSKEIDEHETSGKGAGGHLLTLRNQ